MTFGNLNYWPMLVAAIVSFAFGAVWYGMLGKQWMAARGLSEADMAKAKAGMGSMTVPFIISFVALLVMSWMFSGVLLHMAAGGLATSLRTGVISGFFLWLGFVITLDGPASMRGRGTALPH